MCNEESALSQLVQTTGKATAANLMKIAKTVSILTIIVAVGFVVTTFKSACFIWYTLMHFADTR